MKYAENLKDLAVNVQAKLTADVKKSLTGIIEQEFCNKDSLFQKMRDAEKNKIITQYRKNVGFDKLLKKYNACESALEEAKKGILAVGLDTSGEARSNNRYYNGSHQVDYEAKKLNQLLEAVESNAPSQSIKSKLIARLQMSTTMGEANAIMLQVLGNSIIPNLDMKTITHTA